MTFNFYFEKFPKLPGTNKNEYFNGIGWLTLTSFICSLESDPALNRFKYENCLYRRKNVLPFKWESEHLWTCKAKQKMITIGYISWSLDKRVTNSVFLIFATIKFSVQMPVKRSDTKWFNYSRISKTQIIKELRISRHTFLSEFNL